jgi:serine phosphatase RsbU (regulator of sigma subunit)
MAEVRTAVRAYAMLRIPLAAMLRMLNRLLLATESLPVTIGLFSLDLEAAELAGVSAGHVPALVLNPDGSREFTIGASGPPLGLRISSGYVQRSLPFPPGSSLILYTDGLIERRGETIDVGLDRLRRADFDRHPHLPLADRTLALLADEPAEDDVAVLAVERREPAQDQPQTVGSALR